MDSTWTYGVQVESRWSPINIVYFGDYGMDSTWTPPGLRLGGVHVESRWNMTRICKNQEQTTFDKLKMDFKVDISCHNHQNMQYLLKSTWTPGGVLINFQL